ncbi:MarR family winged helix-turn-helix transcriptional regulator [Actinacidiphila sp. ITFR-21]|uniref:MarR family winged helix-turn-helix transcriptional regulator n=1 Tax=Actinacidiphila sp. ITFR-21 TaxID=3075199 RepID=UPI00288AB78C|nr:MarR family transcriptional regulator [Streptomyces sp. ITFR-21]WNI16094.1 MarR family transcriptional regulator [Streptomyces sp. ITFR-21]
MTTSRARTADPTGRAAGPATGSPGAPTGPAEHAAPGPRHPAGDGDDAPAAPAGARDDIPADIPADTPGSLAERTATDLRIAVGPLVRRLRQFRPDGELTLSQTSALVRLDREGPATASELAAGEGIRPQSMCTIVNALQDRGLVARAHDPHDGRRMVVSLTAAGRDGLHGARRERGRRLALAISEELTPAEQEQLAAAIPLLERITRRV